MASAAPNPYDVTDYPSRPYAQAHPERMGTVAALFGLHPSRPSNCRVLEIGCNDAANLLALAVAYPKSEFVGFDLAAKPVERAIERVKQIGIENVRVFQGDVTQVGGELGQFDYIIAHGLYSWVPAPVRQHILRVCRELLQPNGIAYISYNAYPAGHMRDMVRAMTMFHAQNFSAPADRAREAKAVIRMTLRMAAADDVHYRGVLQRELEAMDQVGEALVIHDLLAESNDSFYFTQVAAELAAHRLKYVGDAEIEEMHLDGELAEFLTGAPDKIAREQYLDFMTYRRFRRTLVCGQEAELLEAPDVNTLRSMQFSSRFEPVGECDFHSTRPQEFKSGKSSKVISIDQPLAKAALVAISQAWPRALSFAATAEDAAKLLGSAREDCSDEKLTVYLWQAVAAGAVQPSLERTPVAPGVSERPLATALARRQAAEASFAFTLVHSTVELSPTLRRILPLLNGTRDRAAMLREFNSAGREPINAEQLGSALQRAWKLGLLAA